MTSEQRADAMPDELLARLSQRGDRASLAMLVERHHALLVGFLYKLTGGDRSLAEDLCQEAFFHLLRSLSTYRYSRPFKPWLYAIAVNCARDHYKQAEISRMAAPDTECWESHTESAADGAPEQAMIAQAQAQQVGRALRTLPLQQREVLILRYSQELSLAEIAQALGIPIGTVKSRLSIGLERLRIRLAEEESR